MKAKSGDLEFQFDHLHQLVQHASYQDFTYLNLNDAHLQVLPSPLPPNLQILLFDKNNISQLPAGPFMPATLRLLSGRSNRIRELPDLSHCTELESIDLFDNDIVHLDNPLPPFLRSLDLSYSTVKSVDYRIFPDTLRHCCLSYCFLTEAPPPEYRAIVQYDHNNIPAQMYTSKYTSVTVTISHDPNGLAPTTHYNTHGTHARPLLLPNPYTDTGIGTGTAVVYENPQNVHAPSIEKSVNESLQYVLSYPMPSPPRDHIQEVLQLFRKRKPNPNPPNHQKNRKPKKWWHCFTKPFSFSTPLLSPLPSPPPIEAWCLQNTLHSIHGVTFNSLLARVWAIIQDHDHREAMEQVLQEELLAARGMCFTGRFSRVLNTLNGFVSEIRIGISDREQMQNQIGATIKRYQKPQAVQAVQDKASKLAALTTEIKGILEEFKVPSYEHAAWLAPLEDLF